MYAGNTKHPFVLPHKTHHTHHTGSGLCAVRVYHTNTHTHEMEFVQMLRFPYTIASNNDIKEVCNELATEHSANSRGSTLKIFVRWLSENAIFIVGQCEYG